MTPKKTRKKKRGEITLKRLLARIAENIYAFINRKIKWRMNFGLDACASSIRRKGQSFAFLLRLVSSLLFALRSPKTSLIGVIACATDRTTKQHIHFLMFHRREWRASFVLSTRIDKALRSRRSIATRMRNKNQSHANSITRFFLQEPRWYHGASIIRSNCLWGE